MTRFIITPEDHHRSFGFGYTLPISQRVCTLCLIVLFASVNSSIYSQQGGTLDSDFSADGIVSFQTTPSSSRVSGNDITIQSDGRIIICGTKQSIGGTAYSSLLVRRLLPDGTNDGAFGQSGYFLSSLPFTTGSALHVRPNGQILVAGGYNSHMTVFALNSNGTPSSSFGQNGHQETSFPNSTAYDIAVDLDQRIYLAGNSTTSGNSDFSLARLYMDGAPDQNFSFDGMVTTDFFGFEDVALAIHTQSNGKILVAGYCKQTQFGPKCIAIARYNTDGLLDQSFGVNGKVVIPNTGSIVNNVATSIMTNQQGQIIIGGYDTYTFTHPIAIRLLPDGTLDNAFGQNGQIIFDLDPSEFSLGDGLINDLKIQADQSTIFCGRVKGTGTGFDLLLIKILPNGVLDPGFGIDGFVRTNYSQVGQKDDQLSALIIDGNERILVVGETGSDEAIIPKDLLIARFLNNPDVGLLEFSTYSAAPLVYPNPIVDSSILTYSLAESERLTITLHDLTGKQLTTFLDGELLPAGEHRQMVYFPTDLASGNYLLVFSSPNGKTTIQVTK